MQATGATLITSEWLEFARTFGLGGMVLAFIGTIWYRQIWPHVREMELARLEMYKNQDRRTTDMIAQFFVLSEKTVARLDDLHGTLKEVQHGLADVRAGLEQLLVLQYAGGAATDPRETGTAGRLRRPDER